MEKIFVLDTSVIVSDPRALHNFIGNKIIIPYAVYEEVDTFKKGLSPQSYASRNFFRILNRVIEAGKYLNKYVSLTENIKIKISGGNTKLLPKEFDKKKRDNQIIATVLQTIKEENKWFRKKKQIILVSKDAGLRIAANALKIKTEDYKADKIKDDVFAINITELKGIAKQKKDELVMYGESNIRTELPINSRLKIDDLHCVVESKDKLVLLADNKASDIKAKNPDQEYALWLLNNPKIQLVSLIGKSGSGKTLLSIASAIKQILEDENPVYKKIVIVRPVVPVGKDIGFLPGEINEKLEPWMKPIYDAIGIILKDTDKSKIQYLFDSGTIEIAPLPYIRGRSIHNAFIYIDECQNISRSEMKTIITRAGQKTKMVIAGDIDQIDSPFIDKYSCGLTHATKAFQGQKLFGYCNLQKSERSELAEMAVKLL